MGALITKSEFAAARGVDRSTISKWISRGRLTAPALTPDGRIDAEIADRQLGASLDPVRHLGQQHRAKPAAPPPGAAVEAFGPAADLLRAKAQIALIAAEERRIAFEATRGRYTLTEAAEAAWAAALTEFLLDVENSLNDLAL